jgi:large subunit ribosomal protein L1
MIDQKNINNAIKELRANSTKVKRNFDESVEVIINLKSINIKNPEEKLDYFFQLKHPVKKMKVCALIGPEMTDDAKKVCDSVIVSNEFDSYKQDSKKIKKLAKEHDFFIAQANIMPQIAAVFGKILGTRGKMPNPKAGCIVPPKANLDQLIIKLNQTIRAQTKNDATIRAMVGKVSMDDSTLSDNIYSIIDQTIHHIPNELNNLKSIMIKTTMGKSIKVI